MNLDGRVFLLSLLLVPACTSRTSGDDDDNGSSRKLGDGCKALMEAYMACYEEMYSTTGYTYESTGYETGYDYDPEDYCEYFIEYTQKAYGKNCTIAIDDLYACLAAHQCEELEDDNWDEICTTATARVEKYCDFED